MPKVTKQVSRAKPSKSASVIDRIQPVNARPRALRMNVYGRGKTGKTRFICTFPKPLLLIGTEDGTLSVNNIKGVDFVQIHRTGEIDELIEVLQEGKYKSVGLDHAGGLQDLALQEVLGLEDVPVQKSWGIAKQQDWGTCALQVKERLRTILRLAETHDIHVGIIAHERNFNDEGAGHDMIFPTVGSALTPSVCNWLNGACDYVCQTYIREETEEIKSKVGDKVIVTHRKTDKKEYCLRVGPHPIYMTGFRLPPGKELPEAIADPSYAKVMELINSGT